MVNLEFSFDEDKIETVKESFRNASGEVIFTAPYAIYVELGTRPHRPPFKPIYEWVGRQITSGEKQEDIAWAVVNKIEEEGTSGIYFAGDTVEQYRNGEWQNIAEQFDGQDNPNTPEAFIETLLEDMKNHSQNLIEEREAIDTGQLHNSPLIKMDVDVEEGTVE